MPGYTPLPHHAYHLPPPPGLQPPTAGPRMMACERAMQHELQAQDQYVRHLELENMRLRVKLEQAEKDVQMATNMVMVACRAGQGSLLQCEEPTNVALTAEHSLAGARVPTSKSVRESGCWGFARDGEFDGQNYRTAYGEAFAGNVGDVSGAKAAGYKVEQGWGLERQTPSVLDSWGGLNDVTSMNKNDWGEVEASNSALQHADEQLLDLNDAAYTTPKARILTKESQRWSTPPPLRPLTTPAPPTKYKLADPFITPVKKNSKPTTGDDVDTKADRPRFHHIFRHDSDETAETTDFSEGQVIAAQFAQKKKEVLAESEIPDFVSKIPDVKLRDRTKLLVQSPLAHKRDVSTETGYPSTEEKRASDKGGQASTGADHEKNGGFQSFSSSGGLGFVELPREPYGYHSRRGGYGDGHNLGAFRYNANKPPPRSEEDVRYKPEDSAKNICRTVMIYNLPPQFDVADIVARTGDAPMLSIKLLPTMGMKGRKENGLVTTLETVTAMMTFFLDSSAEQFAFDASMEPLVIRGRTAIVELLQTPTYPSIHDQSTYATAPGRLISRRIKFHQPGLVPAESFEETLARNSYGFRQPGWIVNKTIKKEGSKNMVTIELARVDLAQFAYNQIGWLREFQGCEPRWVYDHESGPSSKPRGLPQALNDGNDSEYGGFDGFGTKDDAEVKLAVGTAS